MPIPTNVAQPRNIYDPTDPRNSHIYASKSAVPEWKKGLGAFVDETQGLLSAGVGLAAEGVKPILPDVAKPYAEKVRDWGLDSYQRNMEEATTGVQTPNVARIEDIKLTEPGGLGRLGDWTAYHGTKGVAQGLSFLGTGGATGLVGKKLAQAGVEKGVKALAKAKIGSAIPGTGVLTEGLKQTAQKVVADAGRKGFNRGFVAGGLGYGTALEGGSSFGELVRPSDPNETPLAPEDAVGPAAAYGLAAGAVEFLPEVAIAKALGLDQGFKSFMKKAVKDLVAGTVDKTLKKKLISFAGAVGKGAAIGGAVEGTEEGVQSLLQTAAHRWAREEPVLAALSEEELSDLYNSVAAGSLPGAAFGGTVGGVRNVGQQRFLARANEAFERARTNAGLAPTVEEAGAETTAPGQAPPPAPVVEEPTVLGQRPDAGLADAGQPAYQPTSYIKGVPEEEVAVPATQEAQAEPRAPADISAIQVAQAYAEGLEEGRIAEANFDQQYGRGAYAKLAQGSAHEQASPAQQAVLDQEAANAAKAAEAEAEVVSGWTQTDPEAFVYEGQKVQTPEGTAWQGKWEVAKNDKTGEWEAFNSQGELFGKYPTAENAQESIELQEIIKDPELEQAALAAGVDLDDAQAYVALAAMNLGPESMAGFKETLVYKYNSWQTVANAVASTNLSGKINAYQAKWADKHQKPAKPVKQSWLDEAAESFAAEPPEAYYDPDQVVAEPEPTSTQTKAAKLAELPASFKAVVYKDAAGIKHAFGPNLEYLGESEEYSVASDKLVDAGLVGSDEEVYYIYASDSGGPVFQRLVDKQKPGGKTLQELLNTHGANFPWKAAVLKTPEGYHVFGPNSEYLGKTDYYTEASALHGQPAGPTAYFNSVNSPEAKRLQRLIPTQTKSAAPAPTQAPSPTTPTWDQLSKVSGQKGSQDGGIYEDESGQRYYVKWPKTAENAVSEVFAAQLMGKLGFVVPETALLDTPKGKAVTSKWMDNLVSAKDQVESGQWTQLHKAFAAAAWLGHWDIVGLNFDNVMQDSNGHMVLLDFGGTLKYRAQGGVKPSWSSHVGELSSLRDPAVNPNAAKAFAGMTEADLISGVEQLAKITTPELLALADVSGLTTEDAYTLAERRDFLLQHVQELQAKYDVETLQTWVKDYDGTAAIENALANPAVSPHQTVWAEVTPENARYGVIVIDPEKGKVLIRKVKGGYGGYVWSWAKGGAEQGETPVQAAKRETLEELGVETQLVGQIPGVFTSNSGTGAAFYVGVVHPNFDVATSNPGTETEETRWVSYDQAKALLGQTTIELGKARDLEILDVVFGKAKLSHLAYLPIKKGEVNAREFFDSGDFKTTFGDSFEPIAKKSYWSELTQYQKLTVAVASRFMDPTSPLHKAGIVPTKAQVNKEVARIKAAFKVWSGGVALPDVLPGDSKLAPEGPLETGKPVTLSVYHHLSAGDIKGGYINFEKYGGSGHSGSDTKHAFFAFGAESSAEYQNGKYLKLYATFKNPKVIDHGGHSWHSFKNQILAAKAEGHDGLIAYAVNDLGVTDTQVMMWVPEQVKTQELENLGYDGLDPILWHSRSMAGTERKGIARIVEGLETEFGKAFVKAATHAGILEIVPNGPAGVQAEFDEATGKIRLYANNLTSSPAAVLMHEGSHATLETYLGQDLGKFVKDVQAQARAGNASASQALAAATEDKYTYQRAALGLPAAELTPETLAETKKALASSPNKERITEIGDKIFKQESLAYYAEFSASRPTGLSRRFLDRLKAGWLSSDRGMLLGMYKPKLTEGVMVELARKSTQFSVALKTAADRLQKEMDAAAETGERVRVEYRDRSGLEGTVDVLDEVRRLESRVAPTFKSWLFTDSLSADVEDVNRPGLANSLYYNYVDMFGALERKAPDVFEVFNLARSKKAHYQTVLQEGLQHDFIELAAKSKIDVDQLGLWLAARHVIEDKVNLRLALENSKEYARKLSDMISPLLPHGQKTLMAQEISGILKSGDPQDIIQQRMMALVEKWFDHQLPNGQRAKAHQGSQLNPGIADLYLDWNNLKDHGSGLRTPDLVDPAILPLIQSQLPIASDLYTEAQANSDWSELSRMMKELTNETVNVLVRGRVLTQEQGDKLLTKYPHYVPLQREPYDVPNEVAQIFSGGQGGGKVVKTRAGSESDLPVVHVVQNAFAQRSAAISAAEQNLARIYFGDEILRNKDLWSDWFHVAEDGDHVPGRDKNGFVTDRVVGGGPADIPYLKDGKRLLIVPNKQNQRAALLSKAIQNLEPQQVSGVLKLMSGVNSWIRWVNISASPAFMAVNLPRDIWTAVLNIKAAGLESKDLKSNLPAAGKALWEVFVQKRFNPANPTHRLLREWEESGGRISFVESLRQNDDSFNSLESMIRRRQGIFSAGPAQMTSETAGAMIDWGRNKLESLEKFNIMLENISRFAAYKTARDAGWARGKAALLSKDVTTNFDRRGFRATILSTWWLFYNASVQGNAQVVRNILTGPAKEKLVTAVGGLMLFAFMNDMLGAAISDDDDDDGRLNWDSFGEWEKERFARFPIGVPVGEGAKYATVPLPWVFNVFWRAGEMFSEAVRGVRPWGSIAPDLAGLAMGAFNPISSSDTTLTQTLSPTALDPLMQILENRSPFGVPLRPERYPGQENQPASWMAFDSTPKFYKWLAQEVNSITGGSAAEAGLVDQYPADYKVIADTLLGSGGRFVLSAFGPLFDGRPATVKDIPLVSTYVKQPKDPIESQLFHERIAQIEQAKHAVKVFSEGAQRDSVELRRAREEYAPMLRMQDAANDIQRQIKDLRAKRKIAEARGRDDQAQEITKSIQRQMERFNRLWAGRVGN